MAYYPFNGNANDESGNGNHGTVNGADLAEDKCTRPNSAYNFDGMDDYIQVPHSDILNFGVNDFSIVFWIKVADPGIPFAYEVVEKMNRNTASPSPGFFTRINSGIVNAYISAGGTYKEIWGTLNTADNQWHQIAIIFNRSSNLEIYVDTMFDSAIDISSIGNIDVILHDLYIGKTENIWQSDRLWRHRPCSARRKRKPFGYS